ncbi:MAG: type II secretion system F family protein [Burkholderiaceae bacterium]|nr:type II secretion system F family protein [Burkholderiaceae bacterium]
MTLVILALVLGAVLLAAAAGYGAYAGYRARFTAVTRASLEDAFVFIDPQRIFYANLASALLLPLLVWLLTGSLALALAAGVAALVLPRLGYVVLRERRRRAIVRQLPDALTLLASSLRAGASLQMGLDVVIKETPAPLAQEISLVVREQRLGVALEHALESMARRLKLEEIDLLVSAITIAKDVGGNLSEILDRLAHTLRAKAMMEGKIRALTAQGKLQGIVVGLLPLFLGAVLTWMDPAAMAPLFNTWWGWSVIGVIVALELIGAWMIRKIVTIDI